MRTKRGILLSLSLGAAVTLSGCMSETIDNKINQISSNQEELTNASNEESTKLSEEQTNILANLEPKSNKEALFENDLEIRKELDIVVPEKKDNFQDAEDLSQYISYIFFAFYKGELQSDQFLEVLNSNAHSDYLNHLPTQQDLQIKTLQLAQDKYRENLRAELESYIITDLLYQDRADEAFFYRKYVLENKEEIYSVTTLKKDGDYWKLLDDSPSTPYVSTEYINQKAQ